MIHEKIIAEITASSLHEWHAVCREIDQAPPFGSLIAIKEPGATYLGIVHHISTQPTDSVHVPSPLGRSPQEIMRDYPQLPFFFQTTISCLALGYEKNLMLRLQWPAKPPSIHAQVVLASSELYQKVFNDHHYLTMLFKHATITPYLDELILALLTHLDEQKLLTDALLESFIDQFSLLTGNDYRRLKLLLQRIERLFAHRLSST
jgi:hypothetical protein